VQSAEPGDVQALAAANGEGMAVGGLQREELDAIMEQFGRPERTVELGILRGMM
jgi:alkanesulfonate monooxygenase SsuD/methylene tetrahydromethanopterin reductase-like flavin-dependent oxidoreductase (luciferase family)